jgi:hypothetical protein
MTSAWGHFETKWNAYRCASIGLILTQELTFWRSASKVGAYAAMSSLDVETARILTDLANAAGRAVGRAWSIDPHEFIPTYAAQTKPHQSPPRRSVSYSLVLCAIRATH